MSHKTTCLNFALVHVHLKKNLMFMALTYWFIPVKVYEAEKVSRVSDVNFQKIRIAGGHGIFLEWNENFGWSKMYHLFCLQISLMIMSQ